MISFVYYLVSFLRRFKKKENDKRFKERFGQPSVKRPKGSLFWFHAASVGETLSIVSFLKELKKIDHNIHILLTTTTWSSEKIFDMYLSDIALHQYAPYDAPKFVKKFLNYWKPSQCFLIESELWPFTLHETQKCCPITLINGRISNKSYKRWTVFSVFAKKIFSSIDLVWTLSQKTQKRFLELGAKNVKIMPPLKLFAKPNPLSQQSIHIFQNDHPKWLAISTHESEEIICGQIHKSAGIANLQTWIAPRHIERIPSIIHQMKTLNLSTCLASHYVKDSDIVLIDSIGQLNIYFALCPIVLVGGSFCKKGGHNPVEPLLYGCKTFWGPDMSNFTDILPYLPYDGACQKKEDFIKILNNESFSHQEPFVYRDSLESLVREVCLPQ
jgi:3-deoxy-D-manno-octulosonic-acid transferase